MFCAPTSQLVLVCFCSYVVLSLPMRGCPPSAVTRWYVSIVHMGGEGYVPHVPIPLFNRPRKQGIGNVINDRKRPTQEYQLMKSKRKQGTPLSESLGDYLGRKHHIPAVFFVSKRIFPRK